MPRCPSVIQQVRRAQHQTLWNAVLTCDRMVTYYRSVDEVFKALADPTRRSLLDELFREDGQTLSALEVRFDITRFGAMKHLKHLENASLAITTRPGRDKLHFLTPIPSRLHTHR